MRAIVYILTFYFYINFILGIPLQNPDEFPEFPPENYYYKAEEIDLLHHKITPYEFWLKSNRVRINYYNGLDQKFVHLNYTWNTFWLHYDTDETGESKKVCTALPYIHLESYCFESLKLTQLLGEELHNGVKIQIYGASKQGLFEYKIYMNGGIPIRREDKVINNATGALRRHAIIKYSLFDTNVTSKDVYINNFCKLPIYKEEIEEFMKYYDPRQTDVDSGFKMHKPYHGIKYANEKNNVRKVLSRKRRTIIKDHNQREHTDKLTLNTLADLPEEKVSRFTNSLMQHESKPGTHPFPYNKTEIMELVKHIPEQFDRRIHGRISKVKYQGGCRSCWAFAAIAAIEAALAMKSGYNFDLSEQSMIDCAWPYGAHGCHKGFDTSVYELAMRVGVPTEGVYGGYLGVNGICHIQNVKHKLKIKGYTAVPPMNKDALKVAVYMFGPVSASIYIPNDTYYDFYTHDIYNETSNPADGVNHSVLVVGYDVREGVPYWIVKNSWGQDWGLDGYMLISSLNNTANLLLEPSYYPIV